MSLNFSENALDLKNISKSLKSGTKKQPNEKVFGHPVDVLASFVWTKTFGQALETLENKHLGADIYDPNMRTSMTPGGRKQFRAERADFSFPHKFSACLGFLLSVTL